MATIQTLELEQIHTESARLQNSIYHLERSNISLEEFAEDATCKEAIVENNEVIRQQKDRILMLEQELQRRGIRMGHADQVEQPNTNGSTVSTVDENASDVEAMSIQRNGTDEEGNERNREGEGDPDDGIYL